MPRRKRLPAAGSFAHRTARCWIIQCLLLASAPLGVAQHSPANLPSAPTANVTTEEALGHAEQDIREARYAPAVAILQPFVLTHPDSWRAHYDLGYALFRVRGTASSLQENLKQSIRELARSLALNQQNADAHKILGLDLTMIQRDDLAGREFAEAARLAPSSAEAHYFLGRYLMRQGQYETAAAELRRAIALDPSDKKAFENLGITLDRLSNSDEALRSLQHAVELDAKDDTHSEEPYVDLARHYREHGDTTDALRVAEQAKQINPRSEEADLQLALTYRANQDWSHALTALQQAAALNPCAADTQYLLGRTYRSLGKVELSRQAFANFQQLHRKQDPGTQPGDVQNPCIPPCSTCLASGSPSH